MVRKVWAHPCGFRSASGRFIRYRGSSRPPATAYLGKWRTKARESLAQTVVSLQLYHDETNRSRPVCPYFYNPVYNLCRRLICLTAVLVIGMHRSGTSLVAGALAHAGAYLGPETDLMPASADNAKGYWENIGFVDLNRKFLSALGAEWYDPPLLPADTLKNPEIPALQSEARRMVAEEFEKHPLWAGKDPRMTVLLPLWRPAIPKPRFVVCVRNPLDVAGSLLKRDGISLEYAAALWHIYTLRALVDTEPSERVAVFYEEVMQDPLDSLAPAFSLAGAKDRLSDPKIREAVAGFADPELKHNEHSLDDLLAHPKVLPETKRLYHALVCRDTPAIDQAVNEAPQTFESVFAVIRLCAPLFAAMSEREYDFKLQLTRANARLQHKTDILNSRAHRIADRVNSWLIGLRGQKRSK